MALTKIGTDGVKDDAVTSDKVANAINSAIAANTAKTSLEDESVTLAKLEHGTSSNDGKFLRANNGADPSFESLPTSGISDVVSDTSPQLGGDLQSNGNDIVFAGTDKAKFGTDKLAIYHDGNHSLIEETGTGNLFLKTTGSEIAFLGDGGSDYMVRGIQNGAVELYHNNAKKLETMTNGIRVQGGIMFGSDTADANVLDDYEEGTMNNQVVLNGYGYVGPNSQAPVMTYDGGKYVKIGNMVYVHMRIKIGSGNSTNGNGVVFGIMPFYADFGGTESLLASHLGCYMNSCSSGGENVITDTYGGSKYYYGVRKMTSSGITSFTGSNGGSGFDLAVNGWYQIE
jgi:hypothetical protein